LQDSREALVKFGIGVLETGKALLKDVIVRDGVPERGEFLADVPVTLAEVVGQGLLGAGRLAKVCQEVAHGLQVPVDLVQLGLEHWARLSEAPLDRHV